MRMPKKVRLGIIKYQNELNILMKYLKSKMKLPDFQQLQQFLHLKSKIAKEKITKNHEEKLLKLNKGPIGQDYETLRCKIIHNLSSHNLTPAEERLLCRGWEFCIENKLTNFIEFKTDIELNAAKLGYHCHPNVFHQICRKINTYSETLMSSLKRKKIRNISDEEFTALKKP
jgi:hypothetical protein